jgi:recombination protein RecA
MHPAVAALRARLDVIAPPPPPTGPAWSSGLPALDTALGGGITRDGITELVGTRAAGRTTLARRVAAQVLQAGRWVAIIDATRTLAPQDWAGLGARLVVIRPHDASRAAWCADRLLRSGVFALVVLDGVSVLPRPVSVRLAQLARDRETALLVLGAPGSGPVVIGSGSVRLHVTGVPSAEITIEKGGPPVRVAMPRVLAIRARLSIRPPGADRRGAAAATSARTSRRRG